MCVLEHIRLSDFTVADVGYHIVMRMLNIVVTDGH